MSRDETTAPPVHLTLEGEVSAIALAQHLAELGREALPGRDIIIEMESADLEDGVIAARLVDAIREAARHVRRIVLIHPPQALAHALYRIGALTPSGVLQVIEPREELGRSS